MGWSSGTELYEKVIKCLRNHVSDDYRKRVEMHKLLIDAFWDNDWDGQDELVGQDASFDEAWESLNTDADVDPAVMKAYRHRYDTDTDTDTDMTASISFSLDGKELEAVIPVLLAGEITPTED